MGSDSEQSTDEFPRKNASINGAKMASDNEKCKNEANHECNSHQHNGTSSDGAAARKISNKPILIEKKKSLPSESESDEKSDCETNRIAQKGVKNKHETNEQEEEEGKENEEEEEDEEEVDGASEKQKKNEDAHSLSDVSIESINEEFLAKTSTPARLNLVPIGDLMNTAAKKATERNKDQSCYSISTDDSDDCQPTTSTRTLKELKNKISAIVSTMSISSDDADDVPLAKHCTSKSETAKQTQNKLTIRSSGSDSDDIFPNYDVKTRKIIMPDCNLKAFQSAKVKLVGMQQENMTKLLVENNLSEIRDQHQKLLVRRKSDGGTEVFSDKEGVSAANDEKESRPKLKQLSAPKNQKQKKTVIHSSDDDQDNANSDADHKESSSDEDSDIEEQKSKRKKSNESDASDGYKPNGVKSDSDSADFKPKKRKIIGRSAKRNSNASNSDNSPDTRKPKKVRRKRIKRNSESSSNDEAGEKGSPTKGRKNIKKIIKIKDLDEETRLAAKEEALRKKRIEERQQLYNLSFNSKLAEAGEIDELVLDFDIETKKPLISVDAKLVKKLKPHQVQGIKFMWDACFESIEKINEEDSTGGGCILAHCMGLGKTLQVVTLVHALLSHSDETKVERVLVICPVSTVLNWVNEFKIWLKHCKENKDIEIFELSKCKQGYERAYKVTDWYNEGGVLIMGYDMFRNLSNEKGRVPKRIRTQFLKGLIDPGADLVICDEGHLLKNSKTALSKAVTRIRTLRRIVLTGTPLQNNLNEYYCMVQFVKPNLLGKYNEYLNRFVNPITNGQYHDSSPYDTQMMKRRSHILHKLLDGCVQRRDYAVLAPFLPPKHEYVLSIRLTPVQLQLYKFYIEHKPVRIEEEGKTRPTMIFQDFQNLQRIWTHPLALRYNSNRFEENEQKRLDALTDDEDEGSLKDFIDDESDTPTNSDGDATTGSDAEPVLPTVRQTRGSRANGPSCEPEPEPEAMKRPNPTEWWMPICPEEELNNLEHSGKLQLFFSILKECETIGDKMLVFSQSIFSLDVIEQFLSLIDENTQNPHPDAKLCDYSGSWSAGLDYFRLDGTTPIDVRNSACNSFNSDKNPRARLFLISTRAGGLGINLVAANRVIVFDVSWNPSHDIQSIFRVYRFGQKKPCYIYRFLAMGTMEEKIYERQVTKLAISKRVIDEQQIDRHYKAKDLNELYMTNLDAAEERPPVALPKDRLLAEQLQKFEKLIYKYHEQDSLLENKEEETLSKAEIDAAWEDYEQEKTRKPVVLQNYVPQQQPRAAATSHIFGIQTEIMMQLLGIIYKMGNPGAQIHTINQNIPGLLSYLYTSMERGDTSFFNNICTVYQKYYPEATINPVFANPSMGKMGMINDGMPNTMQTTEPTVSASTSHNFVQQPTASVNPNNVIEID